jgi:hypothetical protein
MEGRNPELGARNPSFGVATFSVSVSSLNVAGESALLPAFPLFHRYGTEY